MNDILINTLALIFGLGIIIFVHELGHLLVAKLFDTRVKTFSLGFGKRLFGFERGETDYRVSLIPLGGYVALGGENPEDATGDPREFVAKPRWQRVLIYLAGPAMNAVLSVGLIAIVFMIGINLPNLAAIEPVVGEVEEGSSAATAGLSSGDRILAVDGEDVDSWQDVYMELLASPEKSVDLRVRRRSETFSATVTPGRVPKYEIGDSAGLFPKILPEVNQVIAGKPAEAAGFKLGDKIRQVDSRPVGGVLDFIELVEKHPGEEIRVEVVRDGELVVIPVTPEDQGGVGKLGVAIVNSGVFQKYGPGQALVQSLRYNLQLIQQIGDLIGRLVTRELSAKGTLGGPIEIAAQSGAAARRGLTDLLHFVAFISINIGLLNLMPVPILDGGQIVILLIEGTIRRDLSLRVKEVISQVGFVLIMLLMLAVIWFDLARNLPEGLLPG